MAMIGIVSCDKWSGKIQEDILLQQTLTNLGETAKIISWEDRDIDYAKYSHLILRSVWGYQNNYEQFKKWLLFIKMSGIKLYNDVDMIFNNIQKDKQFQILDKYSISHIPTLFIKNIYDLKTSNFFKNGYIIKPIISGSGEKTYKISLDENILSEDMISKSKICDVYSPQLSTQDNGIMIQPYIKEIEDGEFACIFIDGINTHNMLRFPGIFSQKQKPIYLKSIPADIKELANKVANLEEYKDYLYMRVDIVYMNGKPTIMEVELAEPDLLIKYVDDDEIKKEIITRLGGAIVRRL